MKAFVEIDGARVEPRHTELLQEAFAKRARERVSESEPSDVRDAFVALSGIVGALHVQLAVRRDTLKAVGVIDFDLDAIVGQLSDDLGIEDSAPDEVEPGIITGV